MGGESLLCDSGSELGLEGREKRRMNIVNETEKLKYMHLRRFVVITDELPNLKCGRPAREEERPIIIPSTYTRCVRMYTTVDLTWQADAAGGSAHC